MDNDESEKTKTALKAFAVADARKFVSESEAVLSGGGGGFALRFTDFLTGSQGETFLNYYTIDYATGEPIDVQSAPLLLNNRAPSFEALMKLALDIEFFKIELDEPASSLVRHTAVAHPDYGAHRVVWAFDTAPRPPEPLVQFDREIRRFLAQSFEQEFGS